MQGCKSFVPTRRRAGSLILCLGLLPWAGCLLADKDFAKKPPTASVHQVVCYWKPEVVQIAQGVAGNGTNIPGIAGRVYLIGPPEFKQPVAAQGQAKLLVEMAYMRPDRTPQTIKWEFTKEQLDDVLKKDVIGWGYTIPLPWLEYHPGVKEVAIRAIFIADRNVKGKVADIASMPSTLTFQQAGVEKTQATYAPTQRDGQTTLVQTSGPQLVAPRGLLVR
jgi:hypothetical protein